MSFYSKDSIDEDASLSQFHSERPSSSVQSSPYGGRIYIPYELDPAGLFFQSTTASDLSAPNSPILYPTQDDIIVDAQVVSKIQSAAQQVQMSQDNLNESISCAENNPELKLNPYQHFQKYLFFLGGLKTNLNKSNFTKTDLDQTISTTDQLCGLVDEFSKNKRQPPSKYQKERLQQIRAVLTVGASHLKEAKSLLLERTTVDSVGMR
nr:hypothetical protein L203_06418 [Cryptococcus depauperatus CBS 7841]